MTTTEKLREALQAVEPGWTAVDVAAVRKRARRVRLKRRIAGAVAVAAASVLVVTLAPVVLRHGHNAMPATASLGETRPVPTTVAEAKAVTELTIHRGPLPEVTAEGGRVETPYGGGWAVRLMPAVPGMPGAGRLCTVGESSTCRQLDRSPDGWASASPVSGSAGNLNSLQAAAYWVVEGPVASAVAVVADRPVETAIRELGQGYQLVSVRLPVARVEGDGVTFSDGMSVPDPEAVWVFDLKGRLVARHQE